MTFVVLFTVLYVYVTVRCQQPQQKYIKNGYMLYRTHMLTAVIRQRQRFDGNETGFRP